MIIPSIIIAIGMVVSAAVIANTIENLVVDLAEDFFSRWDALIYEDDED